MQNRYVRKEEDNMSERELEDMKGKREQMTVASDHGSDPLGLTLAASSPE